MNDTSSSENESSSPRRVRYGLVGFGAWGQFHARSIDLAEKAELVAIAAPSPSTREAATAAYPEAALYSDYQELVERDDIDIVSVVVPSSDHYPIAKAVLESGKHLLLEKPMAVTLQECSELEKIAADKGLLLAIGHELRLSSQWGRIKQLIDEGVIGQPQYVLAELSRHPYRPGSGGWRHDAKRVGNWILEEPIHFFDLARWYLSSAGDPEKVYATANARNPERPDLQDNFSCIMEFAGGPYAVISQTLSAFEHHQTIKISGTKGAIWAGWSGSKDRTEEPSHFMKVFDGNEVVDWEFEPSGEIFELRKQFEVVTQAVLDHTSPPASARDGFWSVAMCLGATLSVERGQPVSLTELTQPYLDS